MSVPEFHKEEYLTYCRNILSDLLNIPLFSVNPYEKDIEWFEGFLNRDVFYENLEEPLIDHFYRYFVVTKIGKYIENSYYGKNYYQIPLTKNDKKHFELIKKSNFIYGGIVDEGDKDGGFQDINKFDRKIRKQSNLDSKYNLYPNPGEEYLYGYKIRCIDDWGKIRNAYRLFSIPKENRLDFFQTHMILVRSFAIRYLLRYPRLFTPAWRKRYLFYGLHIIFEELFNNEYRALFEKILNETYALNNDLQHLDKNI